MSNATTDRVTVVGAGTMGHGLAVQFARSGLAVTLCDHRESNLDRAREEMRNAASFLREEGLVDAAPEAIVGDVAFTTDLASAVADADVVLETVSEDLAVKHEVFGTVVEEAPADALLATNTSGIPITRIAEGVPEDAERVVGCHWWNPPYLMPLVEVVRGEGTSDATVERTRAFVEGVDRNPIVVERDMPGFVWNRIQFAVIRECMHLVSEGVASIEDVDAAVRDGYALRTATVGPFETMDITGLPLYRTVAKDLYPHLCDDDEPDDLFDELLGEGREGVASGAGFYEYDAAPDERVRYRDERIAAIRRALGDRR